MRIDMRIYEQFNTLDDAYAFIAKQTAEYIKDGFTLATADVQYTDTKYHGQYYTKQINKPKAVSASLGFIKGDVHGNESMQMLQELVAGNTAVVEG